MQVGQSVRGIDEVTQVLTTLDGMHLAEDEEAPHVVLLIDEAFGPGPAAGPFTGAMSALLAAERLQAAFDDGSFDPPIRTQVVRLFSPKGG